MYLHINCKSWAPKDSSLMVSTIVSVASRPKAKTRYPNKAGSSSRMQSRTSRSAESRFFALLTEQVSMYCLHRSFFYLRSLRMPTPVLGSEDREALFRSCPLVRPSARGGGDFLETSPPIAAAAPAARRHPRRGGRGPRGDPASRRRVRAGVGCSRAAVVLGECVPSSASSLPSFVPSQFGFGGESCGDHPALLHWLRVNSFDAIACWSSEVAIALDMFSPGTVDGPQFVCFFLSIDTVSVRFERLPSWLFLGASCCYSLAFLRVRLASLAPLGVSNRIDKVPNLTVGQGRLAICFSLV